MIGAFRSSRQKKNMEGRSPYREKDDDDIHYQYKFIGVICPGGGGGLGGEGRCLQGNLDLKLDLITFLE